jgi:branched-chain amino acid transport system permease protein
MRGAQAAALAPARRLARPAMGIVIILILTLPPLIGVPYLTAVFISALMFGVLGAIYDLMLGFCGLNNFGFAGFLAVGAYASALAAHHYDVSPWWGLLLGGAATALAGGLTGLLTLRLRGIYFGLMTWFIAEAIRLTIANTPAYTRGALGLSVPPFSNILGIDFGRGGTGLSYYYLLVVLGAAIMLAMAALLRSSVGLAFKALREDALATETLGLSTLKYKLINLGVASFFIGVIGAFYACYIGVLTPTPEEFGVPRTVEIMTITYIGGRGSLWGSLVAGFVLVGIEESFRDLGPWRPLIFGVLLVVIILYASRGLAGLLKPLWS